MKLFSITMVKNEIDIIETFIRYHTSLLDGMVILDNSSTDGTVEVINNLIEEGLPVCLLFDDNPSYDQSAIMTNMLYVSLRQFRPDYFLPLDVDEFLVADPGKPIRPVIEKQLHRDTLFFLSWITYIPTGEDDVDEINPLKRIIHRRKVQHNYDKKVIIPASIAEKHQLTIRQGNHGVDGVPAESMNGVNLKNLNLAHFPVRSEAQAKSKYLVGWLANLARDKQVLFDWYYYYNIAKDLKPLTSHDLNKLALQYDVPNKNLDIGIVKNPISLSHVKDFMLKYTPKDGMNSFKNVLNYSETLARKYSKLHKKVNGNDERNERAAYQDQIILQVIRDYFLIDGWLSPREAIALFNLVQSVESEDVTICEIGSWLGKSSYVLARALDTQKGGRLYCVDPFDGTGDKQSEKLYKHTKGRSSTSILDRFNENLLKLGVLDRITVLQGYSHEVIQKFEKPIDILFIDGNHDYESVLRDYNDWSSQIKKGGYIAFHDVGASHTTGPKQVVELEIVRNPLWGNQQLIDELYVAQRIK